ncbi:hypothetical protein GCM10023094_53910 [Rhodococcus olei]|uniref:Protein kinase domain-containing protein n=1 Tax=Rhodococcus olei TaxID=2161675 RepID=A0ABP8PRS0_9NOCA
MRGAPATEYRAPGIERPSGLDGHVTDRVTPSGNRRDVTACTHSTGSARPPTQNPPVRESCGRPRRFPSGADAAMTEPDPPPLHRDPTTDIPEDSAAAGFEDAHAVAPGGFGIVYRCRRRALDRTVAVEVLSADPNSENPDRFLREQRAMGRLSGNPNIDRILQVGTMSWGRPYIVTEFHPHDSLDTRSRRSGPLPWRDAVRLGESRSPAPSRPRTEREPCTEM